MGKLGGFFLFAIIVLGLVVAGGHVILNGFKNFFNRGKNKVKSNEQLGQIFNQLDNEGFFDTSASPNHIRNRIISEALSECSKQEGFFWGVSKRNIFIKENHAGEAYDSMLVYGNNSIGFHWRGRL